MGSKYKPISRRRGDAEEVGVEAVQAKTMVSPSKITPYLIYLVFVATLGPFQFGFHLVCTTATRSAATFLTPTSVGRAQCAAKNHNLPA